MNILILTTEYPIPDYDNGETKTDYYYARSWVREGHNVKVVHIIPKLVFISIIRSKKITNRFFCNEMIEVAQVDILRYIPQKNKLLLGSVNKAYNDIIQWIKKCKFSPDLVFADFCGAYPELILKLKDFVRVEYLCVFNNCDVNFGYTNIKLIERIINNTNAVAVRSRKISNILKNYFPSVNTFVIHSGIPNCIHQIDESIKDKHISKDDISVLYVGNLITLKNVDIIIKAISSLSVLYNINLNIIGDGPLMKKLVNLTKKSNISSKVKFHGKRNREYVFEFMKKSQCFVMVSKPESYGIVYLEAMANGCYTIGSRGEGIDGVIKNGINGVLVEPKNITELANALVEYINMSYEERLKIVSNAIEDMKKYTEDMVSNNILIDYEEIKRRNELYEHN